MQTNRLERANRKLLRRLETFLVAHRAAQHVATFGFDDRTAVAEASATKAAEGLAEAFAAVEEIKAKQHVHVGAAK